MLKELKRSAGKMLRWKGVSKKVTRYDAAQQATISRLQSRGKYSKELGDRDGKKKKSGSSDRSGGGAALHSRKESVREKSRACDCSVAQYLKECLGFDWVMLLFQTWTGLTPSFSIEQWLFIFYRKLFWWLRAQVKRGIRRRKVENHSEFWKCGAFLGRHMAMFCKATLLRECMLDRRTRGPPGREPC